MSQRTDIPNHASLLRQARSVPEVPCPNTVPKEVDGFEVVCIGGKLSVDGQVHMPDETCNGTGLVRPQLALVVEEVLDAGECPCLAAQRGESEDRGECVGSGTCGPVFDRATQQWTGEWVHGEDCLNCQGTGRVPRAETHGGELYGGFAQKRVEALKRRDYHASDALYGLLIGAEGGFLNTAHCLDCGMRLALQEALRALGGGE